MIVGTGIDVVEVVRMKKELTRAGDRFCKMLFTEDEIAYCRSSANIHVQSQRFGGRFAAKEAFFKALGTGWRNGLGWKDVEVRNDALGKPRLSLRNQARERVEELNISNIQVSISHGKDVAVSIVILEKLSGPRQTGG